MYYTHVTTTPFASQVIENALYAIPAVDPLDAQWARIGGGFSVNPSSHRVDIEQVIISSANAAPGDARLFWIMASWIAVHHRFINMRRLGGLIDETQDVFISAVVGAATDVALDLTGNVKSLKALREHCRPLLVPRPLFDVIQENRILTTIAKNECHPIFEPWGLWQRDVIDKRDAIRPVSWILRYCPEFRFRSLLGADLESAVMESASFAPATVSDLARRTGATRAAVHETVGNLVARGLMQKPTEGYRRVVTVSPVMADWVAQFPV